MLERRLPNSELRLMQIENEETPARGERGILELFDEPADDADEALARDEPDGP